MARLTEARLRILSYMEQTGCQISRFGNSSGWTDCAFQWPVSTLTLDALIENAQIERSPQQRSNQTVSYRLTEGGRRDLMAALTNRAGT
ncbi:hypothetical protein [Bosea minatitlanensis]|uniref:Uncharacterized protein n=1 Tax=Bosea minatitlanensis TaxID=128782 RepID=A0ABW0EWN5_9HYPH|nr:hypothetical protein [Bosea minatitlanensis]MCT4496036.1 hypothetical protein [Bosea minatitlanensis]